MQPAGTQTADGIRVGATLAVAHLDRSSTFGDSRTIVANSSLIQLIPNMEQHAWCMLVYCLENDWVHMIEVGESAPDFTLKSHAGEDVALANFKGDKWVVLHTFPLAFTGG